MGDGASAKAALLVWSLTRSYLFYQLTTHQFFHLIQSTLPSYKTPYHTQPLLHLMQFILPHQNHSPTSTGPQWAQHLQWLLHPAHWLLAHAVVAGEVQQWEVVGLHQPQPALQQWLHVSAWGSGRWHPWTLHGEQWCVSSHSSTIINLYPYQSTTISLHLNPSTNILSYQPYQPNFWAFIIN